MIMRESRTHSLLSLVGSPPKVGAVLTYNCADLNFWQPVRGGPRVSTHRAEIVTRGPVRPQPSSDRCSACQEVAFVSAPGIEEQVIRFLREAHAREELLIDEPTAAAALTRVFDAAVEASFAGEAVSSGAADSRSTGQA